jgi:predicted DNA-binding protein with PD1-like motif
LKVSERKLGRVFHLQLEAGDDFFANVNPFIHMAVSGGPSRTEEVLTGHFSDGIAKGGMLVAVHELI